MFEHMVHVLIVAFLCGVLVMMSAKTLELSSLLLPSHSCSWYSLAHQLISQKKKNSFSAFRAMSTKQREADSPTPHLEIGKLDHGKGSRQGTQRRSAVLAAPLICTPSHESIASCRAGTVQTGKVLVQKAKWADAGTARAVGSFKSKFLAN